MIAWIKRDPWAAFLWAVLGVPIGIVVFAICGSLGLMMWREEGWGILPMMFFVTALLPVVMGAAMGGADAVGMHTAKDYCMAWAGTIIFVIVAFVIPAFILAGVKMVLA
jgi:hypothetical protein